MKMFTKHTLLDPEYDEVLNPPGKKRKVIEDQKNITTAKITNVLKTHFDLEIQNQKEEVEKLDDVLFDCRRKLDRLRACIITKYYASSMMNKEFLEKRNRRTKSTSNKNVCKLEAEEFAPTAHPAVSQFLNTKQKLNSLNDGIENLCEKTYSEDNKNSSDTLFPNQNGNFSEAIKQEPEKDVSYCATRSRTKLQIVYGNVSKYIPSSQRGENEQLTHIWKVYVREGKGYPKLSNYVQKVCFLLHPSFRPNDIIEVSKHPFELTRRGWGDFPLRIRIHFQDSLNKPIDFVHYLKLDKTYTGLTTLGPECHADIQLFKVPNEVNSTISHNFISNEITSIKNYSHDFDSTNEMQHISQKSNGLIFHNKSSDIESHQNKSLENICEKSMDPLVEDNILVSDKNLSSRTFNDSNQSQFNNSVSLSMSENCTNLEKKETFDNWMLSSNKTTENISVPIQPSSSGLIESLNEMLYVGTNPNKVLEKDLPTNHHFINADLDKSCLNNQSELCSNKFSDVHKANEISNDDVFTKSINNLTTVFDSSATSLKNSTHCLKSNVPDSIVENKCMNKNLCLNDDGKGLSILNPLSDSENEKKLISESPHVINHPKTQNDINTCITSKNLFLVNQSKIKNDLSSVDPLKASLVYNSSFLKLSDNSNFTQKEIIDKKDTNTNDVYEFNVPTQKTSLSASKHISALKSESDSNLNNYSGSLIQHLDSSIHSNLRDSEKNKSETELALNHPSSTYSFLQASLNPSILTKNLVSVKVIPKESSHETISTNTFLCNTNTLLTNVKEKLEKNKPFVINKFDSSQNILNSINCSDNSITIRNNESKLISPTMCNFNTPLLSRNHSVNTNTTVVVKNDLSSKVINPFDPFFQNNFDAQTSYEDKKVRPSTYCGNLSVKQELTSELSVSKNHIDSSSYNSSSHYVSPNSIVAIKEGTMKKLPSVINCITSPNVHSTLFNDNCDTMKKEIRSGQTSVISDASLYRNLNQSLNCVNAVLVNNGSTKQSCRTNYFDNAAQNNVTSSLCSGTSYSTKMEISKNLFSTSQVRTPSKHYVPPLIHSKMKSVKKKPANTVLQTSNMSLPLSHITIPTQSHSNDFIKKELLRRDLLSITSHVESPVVNNISSSMSSNTVLFIKKESEDSPTITNPPDSCISDNNDSMHSHVNTVPLLKKKSLFLFNHCDVKDNLSQVSALSKKKHDAYFQQPKKRQVSRPTIVNPTVSANSATLINTSNQRLKSGVTAFVKCTDSQGRTLLVPQTSLICIPSHYDSNNSPSPVHSSPNSSFSSTPSKSQISPPNVSVVQMKQQPNVKIPSSNLPLYILKPALTQQNGVNQILFISANEENKLLTPPPPPGKITKTFLKSVNGVSLKIPKNKPNMTIGGHSPTKQKSNIHWEKSIQEISTSNCVTFVHLLKKVLKELLRIKQNAGRLPFAFHSLQEENKSWSIGKRRAAEWLFAGIVKTSITKILLEKPNEYLNSSDIWTRKQIMIWCRKHGYTYVDKTPVVQPEIFENDIVAEGSLCNANDLLNLLKNKTDLSTCNMEEQINVCHPIKEESGKKSNSSPLILVPYSTPAAYSIKEIASQISVSIKYIELEPGISIPVIEEMLLSACKEFASDLIRHALNAGYNRFGGKTCPNEITLLDIYSAIMENQDFEFLTNKYLGILNDCSVSK